MAEYEVTNKDGKVTGYISETSYDSYDDSDGGTEPDGILTIVIGYPLLGMIVGLITWGVGGFILSSLGTIFGGANEKGVFNFTLVIGVVLGALTCICSWYDALRQKETWLKVKDQLIAFFKIIIIVGTVILLGFVVSQVFPK